MRILAAIAIVLLCAGCWMQPGAITVSVDVQAEGVEVQVED